MKHFVIFLCSVTMLFFSSCSNDDTDLKLTHSTKESYEVRSGQLTPENPVQSIKIGKHNITLSLIDSLRLIEDKDIMVIYLPKPGETGPFFTKGSPKPMIGKEFKNKKLFINKTLGVPTGIYFGDVWETSGIIQLPENAYAARVAFPTPSGCKDYNTLERGINWNMVTTEGDKITVKWSFYTFVLNYNAVGMNINEVVPIDGKKVEVPYFYRTI